MPKKKAYFRKPGRPTRVVSWRTVEKTTEARPHRPIPVEAVVVDEGVWDSVKKGEAEAFKRFANRVSAAAEDADEKSLGWRLIIRMDPERRIPKFEIEDAGPEPSGADDLDGALSEARERGVSRAVEILSGRDMLSAADFGKFIGVSREAVCTKYRRNEVLGLKGAKRGLRYPKWQVTSDGGLLPELPRLFEVLGGESWTAISISDPASPRVGRRYRPFGFAARQARKSPRCRREYRRRFFLICGSPVASQGIRIVRN